MWWRVWTGHPTTNGICGCGDPALFLWFVSWPAHALAHGLNPLYSTAMLRPHGVNLLANTSVVLAGLLLAPVTWVWGPVATVNVASTLAPAVSALAMYWLLRRWTRSPLSALAGGLLYGFSPFMVVELAGSYLMLTLAPVPPLLLGCLDEMLVRQRRAPWRSGVALAVLLAVQFLLSTEVFVLVVLAGLAGLVLLVAYGLVTDPTGMGRRVPHAARAGAWAAGGLVVLLGYPLWFALAGPGHLSGLVWNTRSLEYGGNHLSSYWTNSPISVPRWDMLRRYFGGYQGSPLVSPAYLGWGVLAVSWGGLALWWRDRRLWFLGSLGLIAALLAVGDETTGWTPWRLFSWVPVLENLIPGRFSMVVNLCAAGMVGLVVDRAVGAWRTGRPPDLALTLSGLARRALPRPAFSAHAPSPGALSDRPPTGTGLLSGRRSSHRTPGGPLGSTRRGLFAMGAGVIVAVAALAPVAAVVATSLPLTAVQVNVPRWYVARGARLAPGQVLLTYPFPSSGVQSAMAWQAVAGTRFDIVGGGGPGGIPARAGPERPGAVVLDALSSPLSSPPPLNATTVRAVRRALAGWDVTRVVVSDQRTLRPSERGSHPAYAVTFMSAVLGRPPRREPGAWVWRLTPSTTSARLPAPGSG